MDIKLKMTLWYALLAVATAAVIGLALLVGSQRISERYYEETLSAAAVIAQGEVEYEAGELQIDDDIKDIPDVHISLYTQSGTLIYGRARFSLPFQEGEVRVDTAEGAKWYVLDTLMRFEWRGDVWLRCAKRADAEEATFAPVLRLSVILLPLMILLTGAGGFVIARRAFRPVERMARTAQAILSGGDLNRRIGLKTGARDELTTLAATIDGMLARLDGAFVRERQFTSDAAHELRTPLNAVRLLCEEALAKPDGAEKDGLIVEIMERTDSLSSLVGQLLALSRMDAERVALCMEDTDLSQLLKEVAEELAPVAEDAGIALETEIEQGVQMRCDAALMRRLAVNLLSNAIRYGKRGGYARMSLWRDAEGVALCVSDNGVGIRPEDVPRIWERFWRADAARHSGGTGLGLAIARWIIERYGGRTSVKSAPGEGMEILVRF